MPKAKPKKSSGPLKKNKTFSRGQLAFFVLMFAVFGSFVLAVSLAAPADKGKPGGGGSSSGSLSLVMVTDKNSDGLPNYLDTITFNVSTSYAQPYVRLECKQAGTLVLSQTSGFYPDYPWSHNYQLGPTYVWTAGAADCTAVLLGPATHNKTSTLASMAFVVNP
jgi:hypothetical protein